jgi:membrane protein DedA with SNARE-associated domain
LSRRSQQANREGGQQRLRAAERGHSVQSASSIGRPDSRRSRTGKGKTTIAANSRAYLAQTEEFFARHGGKALILARFVPIVRTFAPFVAGMGNMPYGRFLAFSIASTALWVGLCVTGGYLFGNLPVVRNNFEKVIIGIILVSLLPAVIEFTNHRRKSKESKE